MFTKILAVSALVLACSFPAEGYAVLTHETIVDTLWDDRIAPALKRRFPAAPPEEIAAAHAYAYGGCVIQDLGYYPFGSHFFSDLLHYVRSADFLQALVDESKDVNEFAFAIGAISHYWADTEGHAIAVNPTVPLLYPKLARRFGKTVTYGDDPSSHLRTEFAFDVLQVARGHYAPQKYHDFIGFAVSKDLIERAFLKTYGIPVKSIYPKFDLSVKTYRYSVSTVLPEMTRVAWVTKRGEIQKQYPGASKDQFLYNLQRASYEKEWGADYRRPGVGAHLLALLFRAIPKVGPFRGLGFRVPPPAAERLFETSFDAAVARDRTAFAEAADGTLRMPNRDLDTGKKTSPGEYDLTDRTYDELLQRLIAGGAIGIPADLRKNILDFYGAMPGPDRHGMSRQVEALRKAGAQAGGVSSPGHAGLQ